MPYTKLEKNLDSRDLRKTTKTMKSRIETISKTLQKTAIEEESKGNNTI